MQRSGKRRSFDSARKAVLAYDRTSSKASVMRDVKYYPKSLGTSTPEKEENPSRSMYDCCASSGRASPTSRYRGSKESRGV